MDSDDDESYIYTAERKAKQNFLNEEIIDNHYDPQLFMMFCSQSKEPDLDNWTFDELQECVHNFKMKYRRGDTLKDVLAAEEKKNQQSGLKKIDESKKKDSNNKGSIDKQEKGLEKEKIPQEQLKVQEKVNITEINTQIIDKSVEESKDINIETSKRSLSAENAEKTYKNQPELPLNTFIINCNTLQQTKLSAAPSVEFIVKAPEHVEGGIFSKAYYLYPVFCSPFGWESKRRFSDYIWLREILSNLLPGHFIPPIPPHKSLSSSEDDISIKRKALLIKFTAAISRNKVILSLPVTEMFFELQTYDKFMKEKKKYQKNNKKIENPEQFFSADGTLVCTNSDLSLKASAYLNYAITSESIEKRLKRQVTTVMKDIKTLSWTYSQISDLFYQLEELQNEIHYENNAKEMFINLHTDFKSISHIENKREKSIEEHFNMYFKYTYLEKEKMKELLKERDNLYAEFEKAEAKKGKNLEKSRKMYGFYNTHVLTEIGRVLNEGNSMIEKNFSLFAKKGADLTTETHVVYANLISNLSII